MGQASRLSSLTGRSDALDRRDACPTGCTNLYLISVVGLAQAALGPLSRYGGAVIAKTVDKR